ncbi:MAG: MBOAT family protein [Myxococcota bacterium]
MLFDSALFVWFFITVFVVYWQGTTTHRGKIVWLLAASWFFYASWNAALLGLILFSTAVDFIVGRKMYAASARRTRRGLLLVSVTTNLGLLAYFKYTNFFLGSLQGLSDAWGFGWALPVLEITLPVGISFYTFQTLSYTIDIYRGKLEPIDDFMKFALFVSFFPQLVAGPIVRASHFLPQLGQAPQYDVRQHGVGLYLIAVGMVKKVAVANYLAINFVDRAFEQPQLFSSVEMWLAVYGYALQIYCDFSGYSDIAIGAALLLGFTLPENFDRPYVAADLQDFWRRWHISLSTWLRDYLYIPLGGSRHGTWRTYRNLMATMVLGGLWHGASWNFVIWGALHGGVLGISRAYQRRFQRDAPPASGLRRVVASLLTFHFVCFAWIFFRAGDIQLSAEVLGTICAGTIATTNISGMIALVLFGGLAAHWTPTSWNTRVRELFVAMPVLLKALLLFALATVLQYVQGMDVVPFIYFQF